MDILEYENANNVQQSKTFSYLLFSSLICYFNM